MVEQASRLNMYAAVALTDILVIFLVLCTAQVMTNKIENHQPPTFCERRGQLEKGLNDPQEKGHQVFCCVRLSYLDLNSHL